VTVDAPVVVGRSREQALLRDAVCRVARGAVCVELVGEAGIGKTTMLGSLADTAASGGALVVGGRGSEFERDLPFGLFVDALDAHLAQFDVRWTRTLGADVVAELAAIFPALRPPDAAPRRPGLSSERFRAHRAVRDLLEGLSETRPLVLALDDVHWADSSSVELIGALLRRPPTARVLIALAYRAHQAPPRLTRELAVAAGEGVLERIELGPLSQADADVLLSQGTSGQRDREQLFRDSGGNPFYLHQLARTAGQARAGGGLGAGVPQAVAASLDAELRGVSSVARLLARAASIAGDPFDLDLAATIAELDRPTALAGLDELVDADIVRPDVRPLEFGFRHPLVRRAVYESTQPGWRIAAHARADTAINGRGAPVTARAHHIEQSAQVGDAHAVDLLVSAAAEAIVPGAAAHWLKTALRIAPREAEQRLGLLCQLGEALAAAGLLSESRDALIEALRCWPSGQDPEGRIGLIVVCALVERLLGRSDQARARLAAAARELDDPNSRAGVALAIEMAAERVSSTEPMQVTEPATAAVRRAAVLGDAALITVAEAIASLADYCSCDLDSARKRIDEAAAWVATLDDAALARRPDALFHLGYAERFLDRYEASVDHFDRGVTVARTSGHGQLYVELTAGRAHALAVWGRLAQAQAAATEAIEAARLSENPQPLAWGLLISCMTRTDSGSLTAAVTEGREAVALTVDGSLLSASCWVALGMALAEGGDWAEAVELIVEGAGGPRLPHVFPMIRPLVYEALTRAEIGLGRTGSAADWAGRARTVVAGVACDLPRAQADRASALMLLAEGEYTGAAELARESADKADAVQARVESSRSRMLAGRALAAAGEREHAGEQLRAAEAQLAYCGALRLREQCARELRRIGLRVARAGARGDITAGASGSATLSRRERQVADLVRARHTNREIAELLFLSEKTVESHLRNVFVKFGVTSRADVARALEIAEP